MKADYEKTYNLDGPKESRHKLIKPKYDREECLFIVGENFDEWTEHIDCWYGTDTYDIHVVFDDESGKVKVIVYHQCIYEDGHVEMADPDIDQFSITIKGETK